MVSPRFLSVCELRDGLLFPGTQHLAGHPFDLTKTRLQTAAPGAYTGAVDVVKKAVARDGITGYVVLVYFVWNIYQRIVCRLYRGVVPPLLGVTPIFAVSFWVRIIPRQSEA